MATKVLVAYASRYNATRGIAEFIAETLREYGVHADVSEVDSVKDARGYDAFVIGSAIYALHWLKGAREFVLRNRDVLAATPVWLFSSGPLSAEVKDAQGRDLRDLSVPREAGELREAVNPRNHRIFFGALDGGRLGLVHRPIRSMPAARESLPEGDFRDWSEIAAWASDIAQQLRLLLPATYPGP
jgi:menaquinone-dependent protoporphyrinogen oxidase